MFKSTTDYSCASHNTSKPPSGSSSTHASALARLRMETLPEICKSSSTSSSWRCPICSECFPVEGEGAEERRNRHMDEHFQVRSQSQCFK